MRKKIAAGAKHIVRHATQPAKRVHFYVLVGALIVLGMIYGRNGATQTNADILSIPTGRRIIGLPTNAFTGIKLTGFVIKEIIYDGPTPTRPNTIPKDTNGKIVPSIAMWFGKVNQHFDPVIGKWASDPDGEAGGSDYDVNNPASYNNWRNRKLEYCKRFFPKTTSVKSIGNVTINDWKSRGNEGSFMQTVEGRQCAEGSTNTGTGNTNTGSNNTGNNNTGGWIPFPEYSGTGTLSITFNGDNADNILIPSVSKTLGTIKVTAQDQDIMLKSLFLKIESSATSSAAFKKIASNVLSNVSLVYARGPYDNLAELEDKRMSSAGGANDIIVFENINFPFIKKGESMEFKIVAKINTIDAVHYNNKNFINLKLATSYNHPTILSESNGVVVFGLGAGGYVRTVGIVPNLQVSNEHLVAGNHPVFTNDNKATSKELLNGAIFNNGNYPLAIRSIDYTATAQKASDITKSFTLYFGPGLPVAKGKIVAGRTTKITFTTPVVIGLGQGFMLRMVLDEEYVNTATNPVAGQRVFRIDNVTYAQQMPGIVDNYVTQTPFYLKSIGLPTSSAF